MAAHLPGVGRRVRGWVPVGLVALAAAACGHDAAPDPVARVGAWSLTQERLSDLLVLAQPFPLDEASVAALVDQWVTLAALAQRVSSGTDLLGAEAVEVSLWLETREAILRAGRERSLGKVAAVGRDEAARAFRADTLRLIAHVLRRVGPGSSPAERALQRRTAEGVLDELRAGGSWDRAVARSEDAETRDASGLLGLLRVEELPPPLRAAAADLQPGQVSSVVRSAEGYHVLYRPRFEDVSGLFARLLSERRLAEADTAAMRDLRTHRTLRVPPEATAAVRSLASGDGLAGGAPAPLATWEGGALEVDVVGRYVTALPGEARERLARAPDPAVTSFLEDLALREARLLQALERGVGADPAVLEALRDMHRDDVVAWTSALDPGGVEPFSQAAVERAMEALVARRSALRPVPPLLRGWLLEPLSWSVDGGARRSATAAALALIEAAEATAGASGGGA